jgi:hypothetical protein
MVSAVAVAAAVAGCGGESKTSPPSTVTVTSKSTVAAPATPYAPAPAPSASSWTMPDLVGQNLQAAQDAIQALTGNEIFVTTSTDLTGKGRQQVMDRNWQVCSSTPAPGATITKDSKIDFGVVKLDDETCP